MIDSNDFIAQLIETQKAQQELYSEKTEEALEKWAKFNLNKLLAVLIKKANKYKYIKKSNEEFKFQAVRKITQFKGINESISESDTIKFIVRYTYSYFYNDSSNKMKCVKVSTKTQLGETFLYIKLTLFASR